MGTQKWILRILTWVVLGSFFTAGGATASQDAQTETAAVLQENAAGFRQFNDRVQEYVKLHKTVEGTLPGLKSTDLPELITAHQQALARKLREARVAAKRGDIFTPEARSAIHRAIRAIFRGTKAKHATATIRQGAPLREIHLKPNQDYPDGVPFTTVPPTVLAALPKLPEEVAYRILGRDLLLLDARANLVIDVLIEVMPRM